MFRNPFRSIGEKLDRLLRQQECIMTLATDLATAVAAVDAKQQALQASADQIVADIAALKAAINSGDEQAMQDAVADLTATAGKLDSTNTELQAALPTPPAGP